MMMSEFDKILIVDDERSSLDILVNLLQPHYRLAVAKDGEAALRLAAAECQPSLILLDIMMPGMDGYETCRRLKADPATRPIPVMFLTVRSEVESETKGLELGAVDYVVKPVNGPILLARAGAQIALYKIQQDLEGQVKARTAELLEREQQLILAKDRAEAAHRAKSAFLSVMSHEVRTPLNAIQGANQLLVHTQLSPNQRQFLEMQQQGIRGLTALLDDVLTISDLDSNDSPPPERSFSLNLLLASLHDLFSQEAHKKGIKLALRLGGEVSANRLGAMSRLRQILVALMSNAVKFTDQGEVSLNISEPTPNRLRFEVKDSGMGIAPEHQAMIFDLFAQVDTSYTRRHGGRGLGLAIVRRLADAMGGVITLESLPGEGSAFTFEVDLPASSEI